MPTYHNILVGAPGWKNNESVNCGAAFAFYPNTNTGAYGTSPSWTVQGGAFGEGANFGWSVAGNVDFNGDGYGDVIVGCRMSIIRMSEHQTQRRQLLKHPGRVPGQC
jgi:hypothetical protein